MLPSPYFFISLERDGYAIPSKEICVAHLWIQKKTP